MAKTTLAPLASGYRSASVLNADLAAISDQLDNTLSRDGMAPNAMGALLDMNSNRIINLPTPAADTDAARRIDLTGLINLTGNTTLPTVVGQDGKFLGTDGTNLLWESTGIDPSTIDPVLAGFKRVIYPEKYGAKGDCLELTDATMVSGQHTVTTAHVFTAGDVGKYVWVTAAGASAPAGQVNYSLYTTIASVTGGVPSLTLACVNSVTDQQLVFGTDDLPAFIELFAAIDTAGVGTIMFTPGKGYLWNTELVTPNQNLINVVGNPASSLGFTLDFNDSTIFVPKDYRATLTTNYGLAISGFKQIVINKHNVVAYQDSNYTAGTGFSAGFTFSTLGGVGRLDVAQLFQRGGRQCYWANQNVGDTGAHTSGQLYFGEVFTIDVAYPIEGNSSIAVHIDDLNTLRSERSHFIQNGSSYICNVYSNDHSADNVILVAVKQTGMFDLGLSDLADVYVKYSSPSRFLSTQGGYHAALVMRTGPGLPGASARNINIDYNVNAYAGTGFQPNIFKTYRQFETGTDTSQYTDADVSTGRNHLIDGLTITGTVQTAPGGSWRVIDIGDHFQVDDDIRGVHIHDFRVRGNSTTPEIRIDGTAFKDPLVLENIDTDGPINLINFASNMVQFSGYGRASNMSWGGSAPSSTANIDPGVPAATKRTDISDNINFRVASTGYTAETYEDVPGSVFRPDDVVSTVINTGITFTEPDPRNILPAFWWNVSGTNSEFFCGGLDINKRYKIINGGTSGMALDPGPLNFWTGPGVFMSAGQYLLMGPNDTLTFTRLSEGIFSIDSYSQNIDSNNSGAVKWEQNTDGTYDMYGYIVVSGSSTVVFAPGTYNTLLANCVLNTGFDSSGALVHVGSPIISGGTDTPGTVGGHVYAITSGTACSFKVVNPNTGTVIFPFRIYNLVAPGVI